MDCDLYIERNPRTCCPHYWKVSHSGYVPVWLLRKRGAREESDLDFLVDTTGTELTSLLKLGMLYCDLEAAFEKEIDIITVGAIMQEPAMPSDMDFKNTILNERVQLYDVA